MQPEREEWPDTNGSLVGVGDWIEVWCTWTGQPKFGGRAVQVVDVLSGRGQSVFRLRDPGSEDGSYHYMPASSSGFRKAHTPRESGIRTVANLEQEAPEETSVRRIM